MANDNEEDARLRDPNDHPHLAEDTDASQPHLEALRAPPPLPAYFLDPERTPVRAVARIEVPSPVAHGQVTVGTGVLITPRLVLTCQHVLPTDEDVRSATFDFNYSGGQIATWGAERRYRADPHGLVWRSAHWDCLVLELEVTADQHNFPISLSRSLPLEGAWVNVLHHPQGLEKGFSRGQIHSVSAGEVTYLLPWAPRGASSSSICWPPWSTRV
jgi:hypothetical protein